MTVQEKIRESGEGRYAIICRRAELFYGGMAGRTRTETIEVEFRNGMFRTASPAVLAAEAGGKDSAKVEVKCLELFGHNGYKSGEFMTEKFEAVMGVTAGYFHSNRDRSDIYSIYSEEAEKVCKELGVYVSAVITESKVVYSAAWGCPEGGETVFKITGERNPEFTEDWKAYQRAAEKVATGLARRLGQETFTLTWYETDLSYFKRLKERE